MLQRGHIGRALEMLREQSTAKSPKLVFINIEWKKVDIRLRRRSRET